MSNALIEQSRPPVAAGLVGLLNVDQSANAVKRWNLSGPVTP